MAKAKQRGLPVAVGGPSLTHPDAPELDLPIQIP